MQPKNIEKLFEKYNSGTATPKERALVETWYLKYKHSNPYLSPEQIQEDQKKSLDKLVKHISGEPKIVLWPRFVIAASILAFLSVGIYFLRLNKMPQQHIAINNPVKNDVAPGGNNAILTLSNGSKIVLNSAKIGKLASQGNALINKTNNGQISYKRLDNSGTSKGLAFNTATTPRGGQYQCILSDGTKIWLNSASSITYPVEFDSNERKVELTGEAYFEVAHDARKPFKVVCNGQTVEVLGTHFNINSYSDENVIKTTLLEGSVKVTSKGGVNIIKPGQQAQVENGNTIVKDVDIEEAVAWKNGFFYFQNNNIREVMRQLARWYDVDIKYEGVLPSRIFSGELPRNVNATQILDILTFKKIHYKIDGKIITVMP